MSSALKVTEMSQNFPFKSMMEKWVYLFSSKMGFVFINIKIPLASVAKQPSSFLFTKNKLQLDFPQEKHKNI